MAANLIFQDARLKIERANHHIRDLEGQLRTYADSRPHTLTFEEDPISKRFNIRVNFPDEPPPDMALAIGDAIHNLRTALDYMTWEMVGRDGGIQNRWLKFPTGDTGSILVHLCWNNNTQPISLLMRLKLLKRFRPERAMPSHSPPT